MHLKWKLRSPLTIKIKESLTINRVVFELNSLEVRLWNFRGICGICGTWQKTWHAEHEAESAESAEPGKNVARGIWSGICGICGTWQNCGMRNLQRNLRNMKSVACGTWFWKVNWRLRREPSWRDLSQGGHSGHRDISGINPLTKMLGHSLSYRLPQP